MKAKGRSRIIGGLMTIAGVVYILNFGFGFLEFIPDNLPIFGNLDEGAASGLIFAGLRMVFH